MGGQDDLVIEHTTDLDLPVNELVVGKVSSRAGERTGVGGEGERRGHL